MNQELKLEEIIKDPVYISKLDAIVKDIVFKREKRPSPKSGMKYKRDWYDRIVESNGDINKEYFLNHILSVWTKKSSLSVKDRKVILFVGNSALNEYFKVKKLESTKE